MEIYEQERYFDRTEIAQAKGEYYPTEPGHMESLAPLFAWEGECNALDPCAGAYAQAFRIVTKNAPEETRRFCVDLNSDFVDGIKELDGEIEAVLQGDFTEDIRLTPGSFNFVFCNPPYEEIREGIKTVRLEQKFLNRIDAGNGGGIIKKGGILVLVVSFAFFSERAVLRQLTNHYEWLALYRMRASEYKKFHQIIFVGRRTPNRAAMKEEIDALEAKYQSVEVIPELPMELSENLKGSVAVPKQDQAPHSFCKAEFDYLAAEQWLNENADKMAGYDRAVSRRLTQKAHAACNVDRPPIRPGDGILYMEEVCGVGNGVTGEVGKDLHLMRGIVKKVEHREVLPDPNDKYKTIEKVTTTSKVDMKIVECVDDGNGKPKAYISTLE